MKAVRTLVLTLGIAAGLFVWILLCGVCAHVVNQELVEHDWAPARRSVR